MTMKNLQKSPKIKMKNLSVKYVHVSLQAVKYKFQSRFLSFILNNNFFFAFFFTFIVNFPIIRIKQENLFLVLFVIYCLFPYLIVSSILNGNLGMLVLNDSLFYIMIEASSLLVLVTAIHKYGFYHVLNIFCYFLEFILTCLIIGTVIIFII